MQFSVHRCEQLPVLGHVQAPLLDLDVVRNRELGKFRGRSHVRGFAAATGRRTSSTRTSRTSRTPVLIVLVLLVLVVVLVLLVLLGLPALLVLLVLVVLE